MWIDILIAAAVAFVGLFVALSLFEKVGKSRKGAKKDKKKPVEATRPAASPTAAKEQPKKKAAAPASPAKKPASPAAKKTDAEPAPRHVQTGMSAEKFVVLTLEDLKKKSAGSSTSNETKRPAEFSQRQRERIESQGFKVVDSPVLAEPAKPQRKIAADEVVITQKADFDRKLNAFFRAGDRKGKPFKKDDAAPAAAAVSAASLGGRVVKGTASTSTKTWGEVSM